MTLIQCNKLELLCRPAAQDFARQRHQAMSRHLSPSHRWSKYGDSMNRKVCAIGRDPDGDNPHQKRCGKRFQLGSKRQNMVLSQFQSESGIHSLTAILNKLAVGSEVKGRQAGPSSFALVMRWATQAKARHWQEGGNMIPRPEVLARNLNCSSAAMTYVPRSRLMFLRLQGTAASVNLQGFQRLCSLALLSLLEAKV